jgi:hypothetical protein
LAVLSFGDVMPSDIYKIIEHLDREIWKQVTEQSLPGIFNSASIMEIEPLFFQKEREKEFTIIARMNFGVDFIEPRYTMLTSCDDDRPRPAGMPFEVFAAVEMLWLGIDLDLFDRRLAHVISSEIT